MKTAKNNVRFRFRNIRTGVVAETTLPVNAIEREFEEGASYTESLRVCESAVTENISPSLELLSLGEYLVWTVPGNAVKSYEKFIAGNKDVMVHVQLVA